MSVSGLCQICASRPADEQCDNCGALTCRAHYEHGIGLCTDCVTRTQPTPTDSEDVDTYQF